MLKVLTYSEDVIIPRLFVKSLLWLTQFFEDKNLLVVCKGYGDDYELYTGLYWTEDKDINFFERCYEDFRLWINF